jgi:hypothetical protein
VRTVAGDAGLWPAHGYNKGVTTTGGERNSGSSSRLDL